MHRYLADGILRHSKIREDDEHRHERDHRRVDSEVLFTKVTHHEDGEKYGAQP
jgi:hypothetical protein